ncbi:MAG: polysaccharide deacetylase family protein [Ignavibacteriales bacterium]|nr:polysaccharide deacetylase family protein [Ignavibacteriales bacterium]
MMNLNIGLIGENLKGWQSLLEQEGVSFSTVKNITDVNSVSVIIAGDGFDDNDLKEIKKYLEMGGAVLCSGKFFTELSGLQSKKTYVRYLWKGDNTKFIEIDLLDICSEAFLPKYANTLATDKNEPAVFVGDYGGGSVVVLPFDAGELILNVDTATRSFYASGNRLPFENVSMVSKGKLLRMVSIALEHLHHRRGIPYVHKWYYPEDKPTVFAWRIDTDYAQQEEIESLLKLINSNNIKTSWFVDTKSQEKHFSIFKRMNVHEIGIHGYEHESFMDYEQNIENIRRAIEVFSLIGMKPESFAAPYGKWNNGIARAVNECGFEFSSEFSYDYDNVPSFPIVGDRLMTLQVPIHPISIGSLRREPLFFYHHPKDNNHQVVQYIFDKIKLMRLSNLRMIDYARWWKKRSSLSLKISIEQDTMQIESQQKDSDHWIHITRPDGQESFCSIKPTIHLPLLKWSKRPVLQIPPSDIDRIRKYNPWITINRIEDYFHKLFRRGT